MALVRAFEDADEDAVVGLWAEAFADDPPRNEPRTFIRRKRAREADLMWVAEVDGQVVGAIVAGYDGVRGWLYHLAVQPAQRQQGIATALIGVAVDRLRELGCVKVNLQVRQGNEGVKALYESLGWVQDPAISMGRLLT